MEMFWNADQEMAVQYAYVCTSMLISAVLDQIVKKRCMYCMYTYTIHTYSVYKMSV